MCGRFSYFVGSDILQKTFSLPNSTQNLAPRYNIAPHEDVFVIVNKGNNQIQNMKWGLIPFWAPDKSIGAKMINARSETIWEKNSFKHAIKQKRCIIPSSGFFECKKEGQTKIPHFIKVSDQPIIPFAGIYDHWYTEQGYAIVSFAIITTDANEFVRSIHDRMPVILNKIDIESWLNLDTSKDKITDMMKPYEGEMLTYTVSSYVNNPRNKSEECIKEITIKNKFHSLDDFF